MANKEVMVPEESGYLTALGNSSELAALLEDNLGGDTLDRFSLTRIKVPTGGNIAWTMDRLEGPNPEKEIQGIIPYWRTTRSYWKEAYGEGDGDTPPDCSSQDGYIGEGNPGGECALCPLNQWDSDPRGSGGKACKEIRSVFLLEEGTVLPKHMTVPPTSIPNVKAYFLNLASNGVNYWKVVTAFTLESSKNKGGIVYSKVLPRFVRMLTDEEHAATASYRDKLMPALQAQVVAIRSEVEDVELA